MTLTKSLLSTLSIIAIAFPACSSDDPTSVKREPQAPEHNFPAPLEIKKEWQTYDPGKVNFKIENPKSAGAQIYNKIIPDPDKYIRDNARRVLQTLYYSPDDPNVPQVNNIEYVVRSFDGVSYKSGSGDYIRIDYSTDWIEKSYKGVDVEQVDYETRGVLYHELTHAYQLEPKGCGTYGDGGIFWAFIEGTADAVRVYNGCFDQDFSSSDRPKGGTWTDGYRTLGYFIYWMQKNKDKDFIRKFNATAATVNPWTFDGAMKAILGDKPEITMSNLWEEYQKAVGDKK